jgi:hypothetical protein
VDLAPASLASRSVPDCVKRTIRAGETRGRDSVGVGVGFLNWRLEAGYSPALRTGCPRSKNNTRKLAVSLRVLSLPKQFD